MPKANHPRRGSMQFWPRKRARHSVARVRSWNPSTSVKPLGFICYKAGMLHAMVADNRAKSLTKGETIALPATIVECPPMNVMGIVFYKNSRKTTTVLAEKLDKHVSKKLPLPKKTTKKVDDVKEYDDLRLLVHSIPAKMKIGVKKPQLLEMAVGGPQADKLEYAKSVLGKEITVADVFENGHLVDVHGITKGKGFQGTVKRFGVPIRQHKAEKTKRGIGTLGSWTPKRVEFTVPQSGKMGYHLRTEYNKQILQVGEDGQIVTPKGGITSYGVVNSSYMLLKGSVVGAKKRALVLTQAIRPNKKITPNSFEVSSLSTQ